MPRIQSLARVIRSLSFRKNSNSTKSTKSKSALPTLIAAVALFAAVAFSVSVESRQGRMVAEGRAQHAAGQRRSGKEFQPASDAVKIALRRRTTPTFVAPLRRP